jgi:flagellar hook assembly protein FlgD
LTDNVSVFFGPYPVLATERKAHYSLSQNIPNPFSRGSETLIRYSVAEHGVVRLRILDVAGRLVRTITESAKLGDNSITWDGTNQNGRQVASGVYFYEIQAGGFSAERKMLMVD